MFNFYIDKLTFLRKLRKDSYICELAVIRRTFNSKLIILEKKYLLQRVTFL